MDLLFGTLRLRPYVFAFLTAFLVAGARDLGPRRTLGFMAWVWPLAWLAEAASTRIGVPFGLYHYTGSTRGLELFVADVPLMDSLSFTFLAYASYCVARAALAARPAVRPAAVAVVAGVLMMLLDVVIDPLAVRGDRWFLGRIFYYPHGGPYFGVPLSNFVGWMIVGTLGVGGPLFWTGGGAASASGRASDRTGRWLPRLLTAGDVARQGRPRAGVALYYAVLGFNLAVTGWIGEWRLLGAGVALHAVVALVLCAMSQRPAARLGLERQRA